ILAYDVGFEDWLYEVEIETMSGKYEYEINMDGSIASAGYEEYRSALTSVWGTIADAEALALNDAGYSSDSVKYINSYIEYSDGEPTYYVVEFEPRGTDTEYTYKINITTGSVVNVYVDQH
ncbi:MAG: hypothetical protein LUH54_05860, partial [Firmicutes bacterium]|nr:hypothetical protein [Bacillota bacterium]